MQDPVARVLALYRREVADPNFAQIDRFLRTEGVVDLARRIEFDAEARRLLGRACEPRRWLAEITAGSGHDEKADAIDAIVTASLGDLTDDAVFTERARAAAQLGNDFAAAVARFRFVRELLHAGADEDDAALRDDDALPTPPCDFGPPCAGHGHRFELLRRLGAGANGKVFEAVDRRYSDGAYRHVVVVKVLPPTIAHRADGELLRGSRVQHPAVVRWLDSGLDPSGCGFVVSELVPGRTLEDSGALESLGRRGAVDAVRQVARAVEAAHAVGILHLDLKPANVLVGNDGTVRLCDFGAAQTLAGGDGADESTPFFAAPEVLEGGATGVAADVYALGAMVRWCTDEFDALDTAPLERGDAERLEAIWSRAMDQAPARRHAAARELADDLDAWLDRRPLPSETPSLAESLRLSIRRDPVTWVLATAAAIALVSLGWLWINDTIKEGNRRLDRMAEETRRLRAQSVLSDHVDRLGTLASANGLSTAPQVLALQWLFGPNGVRDQHLEALTRDAQREGWEAMLRDANARGERDRLEIKLVALNLAVVDLEQRKKDPWHADTLMREDLPWWRERFAKDDPVLIAAETIAMLASFETTSDALGTDAVQWRERLQDRQRLIGDRDPRLSNLINRALQRIDREAVR